MIGCNDDEPPGPTPLEERLEELSATWTTSTASLDGVDRTADWTGFTLTANGNLTYSTTNSADNNVWPSSGSFEFQGTEGTGLDFLNRSDGIVVHIDNITASNLDLSFTYVLAQPNKEGRIESIEGNWVFKMTR